MAGRFSACKDERVTAGVPSGKGRAVSASWQVQDNLLTFFRLGHSKGGAGVRVIITL